MPDYKPKGFHSATPYLVVRGAEDYMAFLHRAFEAEETSRTMTNDGMVMHAEVRIGDSMMELSDALGAHQPTLTAIHIHVPNVDEVYRRALEAGAASLAAPADQLYGSRESGVKDKWGNTWWIATHIEDLAEDEVRRRYQASLKAPPPKP